jgi:hypothetical protein
LIVYKFATKSDKGTGSFAGVLLKLMAVEYELKIIMAMLMAIKELYFTLLCH